NSSSLPNEESVTTETPIIMSSGDSSNQKHVSEDYGNRNESDRYPQDFDGILLSYLQAGDILNLISDHEAGRPLDFCKIVHFFKQFQNYENEEVYIQKLFGRWPENKRARVISRINLLPQCKQE
ncbi:hypothetical protein QAD02_004688, partial [Eretmocerus hayati]